MATFKKMNLLLNFVYFFEISTSSQGLVVIIIIIIIITFIRIIILFIPSNNNSYKKLYIVVLIISSYNKNFCLTNGKFTGSYSPEIILPEIVSHRLAEWLNQKWKAQSAYKRYVCMC